MTTKITEITVYWDTQDPDNEGWAYRTNIDSGAVNGVGCNDLDGAISEACRYLGVKLYQGAIWINPTSNEVTKVK